MTSFVGTLRHVMLGALILLSAVVFSMSSFMNSRSMPMFHYPQLTFPFAMSLITMFVIPTLLIIDRKTRGQNTQLALISTISFELPLFVLFLLLWFICAHTGIDQFFGPFRHCNKGKGSDLMAMGNLAVPSYCKIVATIHGSEWLSVFALLILCTFAGLFSLLALLRQGREVFGMRIADLSVTGNPLRSNPAKKESL